MEESGFILTSSERVHRNLDRHHPIPTYCRPGSPSGESLISPSDPSRPLPPLNASIAMACSGGPRTGPWWNSSAWRSFHAASPRSCGPGSRRRRCCCTCTLAMSTSSRLSIELRCRGARRTRLWISPRFLFQTSAPKGFGSSARQAAAAGRAMDAPRRLLGVTAHHFKLLIPIRSQVQAGALLAVNFPQRLHRAFLINVPSWW